MAGPFELKIRQFIDEAMKDADAVVAETVQDVFYRIVARSPVDTGYFRANWGYQAGAPAQLAFPNTGTSDNPMAPPSLIVSLPALGDDHFITNDLPYALALEYGHSAQAPQGMVGLVATEFGSIVREAVAKAKQR